MIRKMIKFLKRARCKSKLKRLVEEISETYREAREDLYELAEYGHPEYLRGYSDAVQKIRTLSEKAIKTLLDC